MGIVCEQRLPRHERVLDAHIALVRIVVVAAGSALHAERYAEARRMHAIPAADRVRLKCVCAMHRKKFDADA
ncbi:hypothetical protein [Burkholderia sp. BCC0322]|uniref:hypothetical protein n=1 Tax=unclassified Burkholderia TaxID=2613784 RepID=UPI00158B0871|nr:hypothetical protein [Burkholderia sp. BCC0322]